MTLIHSPKGELLGGRYHLIRQIGLGGMSKVYEAMHHLTQERVAIKVIPLNTLKNDERTVARFMREAKLPQDIAHQGVVRINDAWIDDQQQCCLVMEYLNGVNLREAIQSGRLSRYKLFKLLTYVLEPLEVAHRAGVIHRDLKPENIFLHLPLPAEGDTMVTEDLYRFDEESGEMQVLRLEPSSAQPHSVSSSIPPKQQKDFKSSSPVTIESLLGDNFESVQVKLLDFGLSRTLVEPSVTQTGNFVGTPWYMSPEQIFSPKSCTYQTDLWSIGIMLYEMLTNTVPFSGHSLPLVCSAILEDPIDLSYITHKCPSLEPLIQAILSCLSRDLNNRIKSAAELKYRLESTSAQFLASTYSSEIIYGEMYPTPSTQNSDGSEGFKPSKPKENTHNQELSLSNPPENQQMVDQESDLDLSKEINPTAPATIRLSPEDIETKMKELRSLVNTDSDSTEDLLGSPVTQIESSDESDDDYPVCDISIVSTEIAELPTLLTKERSPFAQQPIQSQLEILNPETSRQIKSSEHIQNRSDQTRSGQTEEPSKKNDPFDEFEEYHSPVMELSQPPSQHTAEYEPQQALKKYNNEKRKADLWVVISLFIFGIGVGLLIRTFKLL